MDALQKRNQVLSEMEHSLISLGASLDPTPMGTAAPKTAEIENDGEAINYGAVLYILSNVWSAPSATLETIKAYLHKIEKQYLPAGLSIEQFEYTFSVDEARDKDGNFTARDCYLNFFALPANAPIEEGMLVTPLASGCMELALDDAMRMVVGVKECLITSPEFDLMQSKVEL